MTEHRGWIAFSYEGTTDDGKRFWDAVRPVAQEHGVNLDGAQWNPEGKDEDANRTTR